MGRATVGRRWSGAPTTLLLAFAADLNAYVEHMRDGDSACYTPTNSVPTSNHLNGTAFDFNWESHPFHAFGTFNADQMQTLSQLFDFYTIDDLRVIAWGGKDWGGNPQDEMHFQMGYNTWNNPLVDQFIRAKIRPDGFSTFRRGGDVPPPPPPPPLSRAERYALAIMVEGRRLRITPLGIKIAFCVAIVETQLTMYANSNDPESLNYPHDKVGSDHMSSGLFQQQPPWGPLADRMDPTRSATIFFTVDHGPGVRGLTKIRDANGNVYDYNDTSHTPGFYAQKVQGSAFPDRYDKAFNGSPEYPISAVALYDKLSKIAPPGEDDFLSELSAAEQRALYNAIMNQRPSRSPLRHVGEGAVGDTPDQVWDIDGSVHLIATLLVTVLLDEPDPDSIALLYEVAEADITVHPERRRDRSLARAIINTVLNKGSAAPRSTVASTPPAVYQPEVLPPVKEPVRGNTPDDLLDTIDALNVFRRDFNTRFAALTAETPKELEQ